MESASPSRPDKTSCRAMNTRTRRASAGQVFRISDPLESEDQLAVNCRIGSGYSSVSIFVEPPVAYLSPTSCHGCLRADVSAIGRPAWCSKKRSMACIVRARNAKRVPIINWYSPLASESQLYALHRAPKRDCDRCAPELCVRFRKSPFSVGTEKISPRPQTQLESGRRKRCVPDHGRDFLNCVRATAITSYLNIEFLRFIRFGVDKINVSGLLIDNRIAAR